jgi:hypothetical protein
LLEWLMKLFDQRSLRLTVLGFGQSSIRVP